ncbi:MAG: type II toxin-antitoxin system PemK/MazF family toxin [Candidatus Diapherotrites archaeon]|nr:type II toxin-antitoxin system PemK/MazF family toxin [Candidatus Diapherotrites archaeon]MDZ4256301.1 type II toxin-antitoxin system PemK/MazF family toxin [archaeon]
METFVVGDVVVVPFPYSNFKEFKRRPAVVLTMPMGKDFILCQITGRSQRDSFVIPLMDEDIEGGQLQLESYIRPNKLSTMEVGLIEYKIGALTLDKRKSLLKVIRGLFEHN